MKSDQAARILSIISNHKRQTISVPASEYKEFFNGIPPLKILVDKNTKEPKLVILNRDSAERYLQSRFGLQRVRRNTT